MKMGHRNRSDRSEEDQIMRQFHLSMGSRDRVTREAGVTQDPCTTEREMTTGLMEDESLEKQIKKQMGCMAGLLQIFDRHHILTGKRRHRSSRLPHSPPADDTTSKSKNSAPPSPAAHEHRLTRSASELKNGARSSRRFSKETPRLSLDSRHHRHRKGVPIDNSILSGDVPEDDAAEDGQNHRTSSVIARLMGLEPLFNSSDSPPENQPVLRQSASQSRVAKDLFRSKSMNEQSYSSLYENVTINPNHAAPTHQSSEKSANAEISDQLSRAQPRKSFSDSGDVFPEPKPNASISDEIENRLKVRIDESSKDLETLKQILEDLHLKELLNYKSPPPPNQDVVYDEAEPIAPTTSSRSSTTKAIYGVTENDYSRANSRNRTNRVRRSHSLTGETPPSPSPRPENVWNPSPNSPSNEASVNTTRSNSPVKPKQPLARRRANEATERRGSPVRSPNINGVMPDRLSKKSTMINRKEKNTTVASSVDPYSPVSTKMLKGDENIEGKSLLERCNELLHSMAEFSAAAAQPSPVSVLDYHDRSTRSPATIKRNIDFQDQYGEPEEISSSSTVASPIHSGSSLDCDFVYISEILRASHDLPEGSDVFQILEKQRFLKGHDTSKVLTLQRRLIFDIIGEILDREAQLPPSSVVAGRSHLDEVWSEFRRIRECDIDGDLFETICRVVKKDLAIIEWDDWPEEMSGVVLDIERLVFKDMVCEIILDLSSSMMPRRKLVF